MSRMVFLVVGVDEYIVQIDDDGDVQQIGEEVIEEALKRQRGIGETFGYNPEVE